MAVIPVPGVLVEVQGLDPGTWLQVWDVGLQDNICSLCFFPQAASLPLLGRTLAVPGSPVKSQAVQDAVACQWSGVSSQNSSELCTLLSSLCKVKGSGFSPLGQASLDLGMCRAAPAVIDDVMAVTR